MLVAAIDFYEATLNEVGIVYLAAITLNDGVIAVWNSGFVKR